MKRVTVVKKDNHVNVIVPDGVVAVYRNYDAPDEEYFDGEMVRTSDEEVYAEKVFSRE